MSLLGWTLALMVVAQLTVVATLLWLGWRLDQRLKHVTQAMVALGVPPPDAPIPDEVSVRTTEEDEWLKSRFIDRTFGEPIEETTGWRRS